MKIVLAKPTSDPELSIIELDAERKIRSLMMKIECAVCNKPVKSFQVNEDFATMETKFIVFCHGKSEEVRLPRILIDGRMIEPGRAFEKKNLIECSK